jgi:NAD(P)-dependent dehydrogenase (short-subunit alcohol dehydrogenase family)
VPLYVYSIHIKLGADAIFQRGIGSWLAKLLHGRGYCVAIFDCSISDGETTASSLDATGHSAIFVQCDVRSFSSQSSAFKTVWEKWSRLDVFIANAGHIDGGTKYNFHRRSAAIDDVPPEPDMGCTNTCFKGVVFGTTLATHYMRHNTGTPGGKIVVTGSMVGIYPCATFPEYCAAKAAVHQWVKTVAPVLHKKENIQMNCVMPGSVDTSARPDFCKAFLPEHMTMKENLLAAYDQYLTDEANTRIGETVEAAHDTLVHWGHPGYKSGEFAKRTEQVFEPWFAEFHGERSDLPGALQDWPERSGS